MSLTLALATTLMAMPTPLRLSAEVDDAYSLKVNPAGLGFAEHGELRFLVSRRTQVDNNALGWFGVLPLGDVLTLGASFEWEDFTGPNADGVFNLGVGKAVGPVSLGVSWANPSGGDLWNAGLTIRGARWLSLSASLNDMAAKFGPRAYDIGIAFRFFRERVLLSGRWRLLDGQPIEWDGGRARLEGRLEVEPIRGLLVGAYSDLHARLGFQLTLNFGHLGLGTTISTDDSQNFDVWLGEIVMRAEPAPPLIKLDRVAVIELTGTLEPEPNINIFRQQIEYGVYGGAPRILHRLAKAEHLRGLFAKIGPLEVGWAKAREVRDGLSAIAKSGRPVHCQLSAASDLEMYVASACTKIVVPPPLSVNIDGVAANVMFFGEGLERIGVRVDVERIGAYKNSPDAFTRSGMSPEQREALEAILDSYYATLVDGLAEGRDLQKPAIDAVLARGTYTATEAKTAGLVDAVLYPDEVEKWLFSEYGRRVAFASPTHVLDEERTRWDELPKIALIPIDSTITGGESQAQPFGFARSSGAVTLMRAIDRARLDPSVRAIVLRVDSPGGDALASDLIARAIKKADETKPVIASFGDVAASGGYYVSAHARAIYAEPTTITGSIGIFSLGLSPEGLLSKLGIFVNTLKKGEGANRFSWITDATEAEREMTRREIRALYNRFLGVVAEGRGMKVDEVHAVAQGRVWTGADAKRVGLVDELGGLEAAIARARLEAGLEADEAAQLVVLPTSRPGFGDAVRRVIVGDPPELVDFASLLPGALRAQAGLFVSMMQGELQGRTMAVLPAVLEFD